jgi:hypothetical protein
MQNDITVRKLEVQHLPSDYPRDDVFDLAATISRVKNYDDAQYERQGKADKGKQKSSGRWR